MKKQHKQYINEWKSISDEVNKMSNDICMILWKKSQKEKPFIDKAINKPVISGEFSFNVSNYCNDLNIDEILIRYNIILFDSNEERNSNANIIGNSEYSKNDNTLTINVGTVAGMFDYSVVSEVYHELCHSFQYGKGMEKREELYDNAIMLINKKNELEKTIGKILYYTFSHEQDAFAHQFYAFLKGEKDVSSFDIVSMSFSNYRDLLNSIGTYEFLKRNYSREINVILKSIGITVDSFENRMHFGRKRFNNKLQKVYQRYMWETKQKEMNFFQENKANMFRHFLLNEYRERYKNIDYSKSDNYMWCVLK